MTTIADRIAHLSDRFEAVISNLPPDAWSNPSPCAEWTASDVVGHVIDVHGMMLRPLDRTLSPAPAAADEPLGAFRAARADIAAVLADRALGKFEYDGYFGRAVVEETIDGFLGFDLVVHGWDLARATGQEAQIEVGEIERLNEQVATLGAALRTPGVCADPVEVPADASAQDKLLAFLGRDPKWTLPLA
jgi:uncharacterized protein (TIGR03086 family)